MMTMTPTAVAGDSPSASPSPRKAEAPAIMAALRAVIWKEVEQNQIYLALVLCIEAIIFCAMQWGNEGFLFTPVRNYENILLFDSVSGFITLASILTGLLLGAVMPLADRNFDTWTFLIHRPVPRTLLFVGRAIAGLILYGAMIGIPILIAFVLAPTSIGGKVFLWKYMLPPIADFCTGVVWYFSALLALDRNATLYGSRAVPLVFGVAAFASAIVFPYFAVVIGFDLLFIAVLALAVAGSMESHGYTLRVPPFGRAAVIVAIGLGYTLLLGVSMEVENSYLESRRMSALMDQDYTKPYTIKTPVAMPDGTIAWREARHEWDKRLRREADIPSLYYDLEGKPLVAPTEAEWEEFNKGRMGSIPKEEQTEGYRANGHNSSIVNEDPFQYEWWNIKEKGVYYLYRRVYQQPMERTEHPWKFYGVFGINGLAGPGKAAEPFESAAGNTAQGGAFTEHAAYIIDFEKISSMPIFTADANEKIMTVQFRAPSADHKREGGIRIDTTRRLADLSLDGKITAQVPVHDIEKDFIRAWRIRDGGWIVEYIPYSMFFDTRYNVPSDWEIYDVAGKLVKTHHFDNSSERTPPVSKEPPSGSRGRVRRTEIKQGLLMAASNPVAALLAESTVIPLMFDPMQHNFWENIGRPAHVSLGSPRALWAMIGVLAACGLGAAALCRMYRAKHGAAWIAAALLGGPAILLTFVSVERLPRRAKCPSCGKRRPLEMEMCLHCRAEWPKPVRTGTEIFA